MLVEVVRVSGNLLRVSWRVRPTHVLVPDFQAVLRNLPALAWLRARGVRVISRLGTAPPPGRFYAHLWRRIIDPVVDRFVANSDFTRRELLAHGIPAEKIETIENMAPQPETAAVHGHRENSRPGDLRRADHPGKGLDLLVDAIAPAARPRRRRDARRRRGHRRMGSAGVSRPSRLRARSGAPARTSPAR